MKFTRLFILAAALVAALTFSAFAQEDKSKTDKDKKAESSKTTKTNKADREYLVGSRGGCYYLTESGKKAYVDKENCKGLTAPTGGNKPATPAATATTPTAANNPAEPTDVEKTEAKNSDPTTDANKVEPTDANTAAAATPEAKPTDAAAAAPTSTTATTKKTDAKGRTYIKGSRGGCYYLNESGNKVYVKDKTLCEQ